MKLAVDGNGQVVVAAVGGPSPGARDNPGTESYPGQPSGGGSVGSPGGNTFTPGSDNGSGTTPSGATDWSSMLGIYGLPPDVAAKVQQIFGSTDDVNQAVALALAYVRGTDWYAKTYPGIQQGIANGTISNEADYRQYLNQVNNLTQQYYGRHVGADELAGFLSQGFSVDRIARGYQGDAITKANSGDWNYASGAFDTAFTDEEKKALGNEQAGIDSELGQRVQNRLQLAQQRLQSVFNGRLATPSLSLGNNGLVSPALAGTKAAPDVGT